MCYCPHLAAEGEEVEDEEPKQVEVDALQRRLEELEREVRANSRSLSCIRTSLLCREEAENGELDDDDDEPRAAPTHEVSNFNLH